MSNSTQVIETISVKRTVAMKLAKEKSRITMKDVASKAGVSVATVSGVLNNRTGKIPFSDQTRVKVRAAVKELGYYINEQARSLRLGKSNTISVAVSDMTQPFSTEIIRVIGQEIADRKYHFFLFDTQNTGTAAESYLNLFRQRRIDGILVVGATNEIDDSGALYLVENGVPLVLIERQIPDERVSCVLVDNVKGGYLATEHLASQGRKRIAFITGTERNIVSNERMEGYRQALTQHGLKFSESLVSQGGLTPECGYRAMQRLLELKTKPDAIFAFNDMVAIGAIRACSDSGLNIPRDIGVVGFDDIPIASYYEPPLTTIRQPVTKMGREGVKMLLKMLGDKPAKNSGRNTILKPELIVRKS